VLVLDEPTNDLDIETLELLESLLLDYGGTLFLVSHDRAFLDNVVTEVIAFEGDGVLREYVGGYSDWLRQRSAPAKKEKKTPVSRPAADAARAKASTPAKLTFKETRELEALPGTIAALESEQSDVTRQLADSALYRDEPERVKALQARYTWIEAELMRWLARWEELEARHKTDFNGGVGK
jgi:ATP-binding cassette subfamily F protein uup